MQLNFFTDYCLRILIYLHRNNTKLSSTKNIADYYKISLNHTRKIVYQLSKLEYIKTVKGKNGGIKIEAKTYNIKLGDFISLLEPKKNFVECFNNKNNKCILSRECKLKFILSKTYDDFFISLNKYNIGDILYE